MAYNHAKGLSYIYEDKGICFVPIPKNSSTTIRRLNPDYRVSNFLDDPTILENYKTICVVRDPFERFCSAYIEINKRALGDGVETRKKKFFKIHGEPKRFYSFIEEVHDYGFFDAHIEPQMFYMTDLDNNIVIDKVYKIEETNLLLENEFSIINSSHYNKNSGVAKSTISQYLRNNKELSRMVLKMYRKDIDFILNFKEQKK